MSRLNRIAPWISLAIVAAFCARVYCHKLIPVIPTVSASALAAQQPAPQPPDQGPDPAAVNQAPAGPSYTTEAPPPPDQQGNPAAEPEDSNYADQPVANTADAPPPLPEYVQPPCPGDGYMWEPGYWASSPQGYYWVPGAWVESPYTGALWTPGYWGFYTGRYWFHPGHWGLHIGYYGGINYGFGYIGVGYEGGYWNAGHFTYNRFYNNINDRRVHNAYRYDAGNRAAAGRDAYNRESPNRENNNSRASFHGGTGGTQFRPQASEAAAWREPTAARMNTQVQHEQRFQSNRGQFANTNHGQPARPSISRPIQADRNVKPTTRNQSHGAQPQQHQR
ncbi:MAG: hypothetical protein ABR928_17600 [Terracidiphilus sp.]